MKDFLDFWIWYIRKYWGESIWLNLYFTFKYLEFILGILKRIIIFLSPRPTSEINEWNQQKKYRYETVKADYTFDYIDKNCLHKYDLERTNSLIDYLSHKQLMFFKK